MRTSSFRTLNVESIEDRSLPSSGYLFATQAPLFFTPWHAAQDAGSYSTLVSRTMEIRELRSGGVVLTVRFHFDPIFVVREPSGSDLGNIVVVTPPSQPGPVTNNGGNADSGTSSEAGSGNGPIVNSPRALTHAQAANPGNVALALANESTQGSLPATAEQAGASAALQVAGRAVQPNVQSLTPISNSHLGYANTAIVGPSDEAASMPPGPSAAEVPVPMPMTESDAPSASATVEPVAGFLPIDLSTLHATASQFLDRVADLAPDWPDGMPSMTDSLWVAAAGLLAGAAVYGATNRQTRPAREAFGSASGLSEWERRNARSAG